MSYRDKIFGTGNERWSISLATHLGTDIPNETSRSDITVPRRRVLVEQELAKRNGTHRVRDPIAGYNCFGHVFASRRTALYEAKIEEILSEDGYGEINDEKDFAAGDIVVYFDRDGPTHVARIVRFDALRLLAAVSQSPAVQPQIPIVLSKIDDVSGEYEHAIDDFGAWTNDPTDVARRVYRERHVMPKKLDEGWRQRVLLLGTPDKSK